MSHNFKRLTALVLMLAAISGLASAWPSGGVPVAPVPNRGQDEPRVLLGRQGAVFTFWSDGRWQDGFDLYGQLLTSSGYISSGWPDTGLMIARAFDDQRAQVGLSHPDGSFILGILDFRELATGGTGHTYLSRVLPNGRIDPVWPRHGFQAIHRSGGDSPHGLVWTAPDTLVTFSTHFVPGKGYFLGLLFQSVAVTPVGPQLLWGSEGVLYDWRPSTLISTAEIAPDGAGGVFALFDEYTAPLDGSLPPEADLYLMRLGRDGLAASRWEPGARAVCVAPGMQEKGAICPDGADGIYVTWADARDGAGLLYPDNTMFEDIRLLRLTSDGAPWPGWPADGMLICNAEGWQSMPELVQDGAGGVYVAWHDISINVTRVRGDGTFAPGWDVNGIPMSDLFAYGNNARMILDDSGGVYVLFEDLSYGKLMLQHVLSDGVLDPRWPTSGLEVNNHPMGDIVSDGEGGCYVTFTTQLIPFGLPVVAVNRYGIDGVVPVKLAETTAEVEDGSVHLAWHGLEVSGDLAVQRRTDGTDPWQSIGAPVVRGRDLVEYDDTGVVPGKRYAYRLIRGAEVLSEEHWVDVPAATFALAGARPNPSLARELSVAFTLAGQGRASLEVLDLAGRREHTRPLDTLAPGRHVLSLADAGLAPGMHWLRLTEGARVARARFVVVR